MSDVEIIFGDVSMCFIIKINHSLTFFNENFRFLYFQALKIGSFYNENSLELIVVFVDCLNTIHSATMPLSVLIEFLTLFLMS